MIRGGDTAQLMEKPITASFEVVKPRKYAEVCKKHGIGLLEYILNSWKNSLSSEVQMQFVTVQCIKY